LPTLSLPFCSSEKALELRKLQPKLDQLVKTLGGADKVEAEGLSAWKAEEDATDGSASDLETKSKDFASTPNAALRKRAGVKPSTSSVADEEADEEAHDRLEAFTYHPNTELSALAIRIAELHDSLVSTGPAKVRYPSNLTYYNFLDFLAVPTLVYELEYPRTNVIRPLYVAEKTGALFGTFGILILIVEHYIIPVKPQAGDSFLKSALDLALPFMRELSSLEIAHRRLADSYLLIKSTTFLSLFVSPDSVPPSTRR
jgi:sterol O-acyltransferase